MRARHPTVYPSISKATSAFLLTLSVRKGSELKFRDCLHYVKLLLNVLFPYRRLVPHDTKGVIMDYILVCYWIAVKPDEWEGGRRIALSPKRERSAPGRLPKGWPHLTVSRPTYSRAPSCGLTIWRGCYARSSVLLKVETREELTVGAKPEQLVALLRTLPSDAVVVCGT